MKKIAGCFLLSLPLIVVLGVNAWLLNTWVFLVTIITALLMLASIVLGAYLVADDD